jgi:hypothetical protein
MAAWRGYANLLLDKTKKADTDQAAPNRAMVKQTMWGMGDVGEHATLWKAHKTDIPLRDAFPSEWESYWGML